MNRKPRKASGGGGIRLGPVSPELRRATELFQAGRVAEAAPLVDAAVARNPRDPNALRIKALIILRSGLILEAQKILDRAHKIDPRNPMMPLDQAVMHKLGGRYPEMVESCREALKRMPGSRRAEAMLAQAYEGGGSTEQAIRFIEETVVKRGLDAEMGETYANVLELAGRREDALVVVERLLDATATQPPVRRRLLLHRGRMLEKLARFDEAMDSFDAGHAVFPVNFDPDEWDRRLDSIIEATTPMSLPNEMSDAAASEIPIFIASLPRSGTSLVERIIGVHPSAHGAGETGLIGEVLRDARGRIGQEPYRGVRDATPEVLETLRRDYLERQNGLFGHSARIVNKHLQNWQFLPIIAAWFPKAQVIRIDRAPADVGISIYGQNLPHDRMPWATRLDWIGRMILSHQRFSDAMKDRIPNPWLDLNYSDLVTEPEPAIRSLIDFLGLEWDDRCLEPHRSEQGRGGRRYMPTLSIHQVRQPIGRGSLDRAAAFGDRMAPLHRGLARDH
jgi:tetratricopeptide (TPR) repeat protein